MNLGSKSPTEPSRIELLVDSITDYAIYLLDANGIVSTWNAGAQRIKGYAEEEIIGEHFSTFYPQEAQEADLPARALVEAEREGRFEHHGWLARKDGSRFWANIVVEPAREPCGKLIGFAAITRDLTQRRLADEALRQSEERFRLLVESVTDYAIYMLNKDGIVSSWNAGAKRAKGYEAKEIIGSHFSRFYTPEDREAAIPAKALATAESEGRFEAEGWRVRKDGTRFWANVVLDPVRDDSGELVGFAKVTRDLTERRAAQEALEKAQETFYQSQKMDAIGQLTGGVAHDFNNLLAAVLGSLELAKRRLAAGADPLRFIDNAMQAARRGATLTQRMLAFARKQELKLTAVDVPALVRGMAELLQRTLGAGIAIETRFPLMLSEARTDPAQLELAILNLAVNARDAMPKGGRIIIGAEREVVGVGHPSRLGAGSYVKLSVADDGEGMDEETLSRAMEPFYTTKGVGKGTGLGLSMAHGLADQCGGRLTLESRKGAGTTATLWLPLAKDGEPRLSGREEELAAAASRSLLILAVDDDDLVLTTTVAMLEDMGHRVLSASRAEEALELLHSHPVELMLTDYAMPGMNGFELAQTTRERWPKLPIVVVTGYAEAQAESSAWPLRLPRLAKPFREDSLARVIEEATR